MNNNQPIPASFIKNFSDHSGLKRNAEPCLQYEATRRVHTNPSSVAVGHSTPFFFLQVFINSMKRSYCGSVKNIISPPFFRDTRMVLTSCGARSLSTTTATFFEMG